MNKLKKKIKKIGIGSLVRPIQGSYNSPFIGRVVRIENGLFDVAFDNKGTWLYSKEHLRLVSNKESWIYYFSGKYE